MTARSLRWWVVPIAMGIAAAGTVPAEAAPSPDAAVVRHVSKADQGATRRYWTRARMTAATVAGSTSHGTGAPPGTPTATMFDGVPTVGALFFTTGGRAHFCTASVVLSATRDLILTAAHCVYSSSYVTNVEFVPGYHSGDQPYGAWPVQAITVAEGWQTSQDQNLDFAFLQVAPAVGSGQRLQDVTGGLRLGIDAGYRHRVTVIGYNNTDDAPVECATRSFEFERNQMQFNCHDYWDGTSGGPWITHFDPETGAGTVIGDIGGYEQGGDFEYTSYSPYFGLPTLRLYLRAEVGA
jgi:V8-like Glu-specific endopeptidase